MDFDGFKIIAAGRLRLRPLSESQKATLAEQLPLGFILSYEKKSYAGVPGLKLATDEYRLSTYEDYSFCECLYELAIAANCGFRVSLKEVPISYEVIEVSERLEINPFEEPWGGVLFAAKNPEGLLEALRQADIPCNVVGELTAKRDKTLIRGDEEFELQSTKRQKRRRLLEGKNERENTSLS